MGRPVTVAQLLGAARALDRASRRGECGVLTTLQLILCGFIGVLGGTLAGTLGFGGGAVIPPLLTLVLRIEQHLAQALSLGALLPPVGLPALLAYRAAGVRPDVRLAISLIVGFVAGAPGGAWLAQRLSAGVLRWAFAVLLAATAVRAFGAGEPAAQDKDEAGGRPRVAVVAGLGIGVAAGAFSGLLGIAGGVVALLLLRATRRLTPLEAQSTTLVMMLPPVGLPALVVYAHARQGLPWSVVAVVAAGFTLGSALGGRLAVRVSRTAARRAYGLALLGLAILIVVR